MAAIHSPMQSKAATVAEYLKSLPEDRRVVIEAVRRTILANLDADYAEGMAYGMIGYVVPHSRYPAGYHCDPKQPLPFAALASQKGHMSLHLMGCYMNADLTAWFEKAWNATGRTLDMGKACVRFKKLEDLALDVIGEVFRRMPAKAYIARYEANLAKGKTAAKKTAEKPAKKATKKPAAKPTRKPPRKVVKKATKKTSTKTARR
jgi:Domain of unknown function (DU1801)